MWYIYNSHTIYGVDLYILICKSTENKEIENMVRLDNVYNELTNGGGYLTNHINKHEETRFIA